MDQIPLTVTVAFQNRLGESQDECGEAIGTPAGSWHKAEGLRWALQVARPTCR